MSETRSIYDRLHELRERAEFWREESSRATRVGDYAEAARCFTLSINYQQQVATLRHLIEKERDEQSTENRRN